MLLVFVTFGLVLGIIFGGRIGCWSFAPEMAQEAAMRARIGDEVRQVAKAVALLKAPDRLSDLPTSRPPAQPDGASRQRRCSGPSRNRG